jgi:hypothetical protein
MEVNLLSDGRHSRESCKVFDSIALVRVEEKTILSDEGKKASDKCFKKVLLDTIARETKKDVERAILEQLNSLRLLRAEAVEKEQGIGIQGSGLTVQAEQQLERWGLPLYGVKQHCPKCGSTLGCMCPR